MTGHLKKLKDKMKEFAPDIKIDIVRCKDSILNGHKLPLVRLNPPNSVELKDTPVILMHDAGGEGSDFIESDSWALGAVRAGHEVWLAH